ncbi:hypothetical protein CP061683_1089B, partial [Chlamydia psittaci 06-1683]
RQDNFLYKIRHSGRFLKIF